MTNKINMTELLADREKGTDGPWDFGKERRWLFRDNLKHDGHFSSTTIMKIDDDAFRPSEPDASRMTRLPDLEAAYIEAVEALKRIKADPANFISVCEIARTTLEKIHAD